MEYIKVTKDNIDQEHICCALSQKDDVQVISKKKWMKECFDDGLIFIKAKNEENALLNMFQLKMHGFLLLLLNICILIAYGFRVHLKDTVMPMIC